MLTGARNSRKQPVLHPESSLNELPAALELAGVCAVHREMNEHEDYRGLDCIENAAT